MTTIDLRPPQALQNDLDVLCKEMKELGRCVNAGTYLPCSPDDYQRDLSLSGATVKQFKVEIGELVDTYKEFRDHCLNFQVETFPYTARLASIVYRYAAAVMSYYRAVYDVIDISSSHTKRMKDRVITYVCEEMVKRADEIVSLATGFLESLTEFNHDVELDELTTKQAGEALVTKLDNNIERLNTLTRNIKEIQNLAADQGKREKGKHYWLPYVGKLSSFSDSVKDQAKSVIESLRFNRKQEDETTVASCENMTLQFDLMRYELDTITKSTKQVTHQLELIQGHFKAVSIALGNLKDKVKDGVTPDLLSPEWKVVEQEWDALGQLADTLRQLVFEPVVNAEELLDL